MDDVLREYRDELKAIERRVAAEIVPGRRGLVIAGLIGAVVVAMLLPYPHAGSGWAVFGQDLHPRFGPGVVFPAVFAHFVLVFGILASGLALLTRRWAFAWIAMYGTALGTVIGFLALWSRQTPTGGRPPRGTGTGAVTEPVWGLSVLVVAMLVMAVLWVGLVWSRANVMPRRSDR
ncbi:hypothetical protein G4X40_07285 [Rhodococcus sp. D2-41]|uniref:Uncharacterized protein n=1 Tax=Speluncibacter jeojiensis TaxID=2710754 RepID=A0A9X4M9B6_9ACTN|nr:hypothetical protein [Rhodococcus sp. D2-41]MDG3009948.1 hypothetical protein [Rhodococcus sp. D2-41]MDG3016351.1 hypothetical protein [Corynebacteriales bacterium D3-21]